MQDYTLYTADYLITQNKQRQIIEKAALAIKGNCIESVGHAELLERMYPEAKRVDLGKAVILPGLINAHTHVPMSALRGYSDDKALMDWLTQDIFPIEAKFHAELIETATRLSMAEMLRTGTTAFYDMYMMEGSVFKAADSMGLRGVLGESTTQYFPSLAAQSKQDYFELVRQQAECWAGHPRLRQAITPHAPYTTNPELLQECYATAQDLGALFGMHLAETKTETEYCQTHFGKSPVAYCHDIGLLSERSSFFHLVELSEADAELLAAAGCCGVHNPASNMKLASGCAPIGMMQAKGLTLALGTDGPASNNAQNMQREIYVACLLHKVNQLDPTACPAQMALDMATLGGAKAIAEPLVGALEPGMKADFTALSLTEPHMQPVHHIISTLAYAATGLETVLTVVDGKELYRDGQFLSCDYPALCEQMEDIRQWIRKQKKS